MNEPEPPSEPTAAPARLSPESKVGLFVLAGLAVLMISILMLGDIHFRAQNAIHITFKSVEGITDKSPVKISGVEIGSVKKVELVDDHAQVTIALRKDIKLYKNATARIRSTGIIGTKFLAFYPGQPQPGLPEDAQRLNSGDTIKGQDTIALDELVERVAKSLDQFTGDGKMAGNLNATLANLRSITDSLNAALGQQRQSLVTIVKNIEGFSSYAKSVGAHLDEILSIGKKDIEIAIHALKDTLERLNTILASVQRGEGAMGALVSDRKTGEDVKQTLVNLKQTSESAKEVLARFTKVRAFWEITGRQDFKAEVSRADLGLRFEPRPNKFYYLAGQNLGNDTSIKNSPQDYERRNTITALLGRHWGPFTGALGFIKSRGGVEVRYRPFQDQEVPVLPRLELLAQGFDFGRNDNIKGRPFAKPNYAAGARMRLNSVLTAGIQAEDIAETTDWTGTLNIAFEDRDIAYLLGFASFAR